MLQSLRRKPLCVITASMAPDGRACVGERRLRMRFRALRPVVNECNAQAWVRHCTAHHGTTGFLIRLVYEDVLMAMSYFAGKREQLAAKVSQASADLSWSSRNNKANTQTIRVE